MGAELWRRRHDYDVICVIDYRGVGLPAIFAGRHLHRPVVIQAQTEGVLSGSHLGPIARMVSWPIRRAYTMADAVACISKGIQAEAIAAGVPADRVHYLPNTVDTDCFHPAEAGERDRRRAELGWPVDRPIGIFVGRLSREKGIVDLLQAWQRVPAPATLVVVGPDAGPSPNRSRAPKSPCPPRRPRDLPRRDDGSCTIYRAADFAVVPSHWNPSACHRRGHGDGSRRRVRRRRPQEHRGRRTAVVPAQDSTALAAAIQRSSTTRPTRAWRLPPETAMQFDERPCSSASARYRSSGGSCVTSQPPTSNFNLRPPASAATRLRGRVFRQRRPARRPRARRQCPRQKGSGSSFAVGWRPSANR